MRSVGLSLARGGRAGTMQNQGKKSLRQWEKIKLFVCIFSFPDQLQYGISFILLKLQVQIITAQSAT